MMSSGLAYINQCDQEKASEVTCSVLYMPGLYMHMLITSLKIFGLTFVTGL